MAQPTLVIVGSIGIDHIETPFVKKENLLGGSVSYACAAASFFSPPGLVGVVGDDFPETFLDLYRALMLICRVCSVPVAVRFPGPGFTKKTWTTAAPWKLYSGCSKPLNPLCPKVIWMRHSYF